MLFLRVTLAGRRGSLLSLGKLFVLTTRKPRENRLAEDLREEAEVRFNQLRPRRSVVGRCEPS